jgi:hypothetical protein
MIPVGFKLHQHLESELALKQGQAMSVRFENRSFELQLVTKWDHAV